MPSASGTLAMIPVETTPIHCSMSSSTSVPAAGRSREDSFAHIFGWSAAFAVAGLAMLAALSTGLLCFRFVVETAGPNTDAQTSPSKDLARFDMADFGNARRPGSGLLFTAVYEQSGLFASSMGAARPHTAFPIWIFPFRHRAAGFGGTARARNPAVAQSHPISVIPSRSPLVSCGIGIGLLFESSPTRSQHGHRCAAASWVARTGQPAWLVACFTALTVAELLVYPLGMSLMTRLSPTDRDRRCDGPVARVARGRSLARRRSCFVGHCGHTRSSSVLAALALAAVVVLALAARPIRRALADNKHADKA